MTIKTRYFLAIFPLFSFLKTYRKFVILLKCTVKGKQKPGRSMRVYAYSKVDLTCRDNAPPGSSKLSVGYPYGRSNGTFHMKIDRFK